MTEELRMILMNNGLEDYIKIFEQHKLLDIRIVSDLTESDLEKIGISALGDRKKILRLFLPKPEQRIQDMKPKLPHHVVVQHSTMSGEDVSTGFGKGFGETVGKKAGGCAWFLGIITIIIIVIAIILASL
jgi:hypothetical protein